MSFKEKINVTQVFLPSQDEYNKLVKRAWDKKWLTNRGELVLELEDKIKIKLDVNHLVITNNGTIPIQIALKVLGNGGEIITTPFSYVATTSAIMWGNCTPVFVDIHPEYLTIDESKIESAITNKTTAILATHVYGNPCNVDVIEKIASKHNLKVIYDAAHCFGVKYKNESIFNFGDVSTCSFHATKIFHTGEGGALFSNNKELFDQLYYSHNFGHNGALDFHGIGINGKISELQAAMGLAVFPYIEHIINERKKVVEYYNNALKLLNIDTLKIRNQTEWNYSYYPIIFQDSLSLLKVQEALSDVLVYTRRYFYPPLNKLPYVEYVKMPITESIASRVLCLPLYVGLKTKDLERITETIIKNI